MNKIKFILYWRSKGLKFYYYLYLFLLSVGNGHERDMQMAVDEWEQCCLYNTLKFQLYFPYNA